MALGGEGSPTRIHWRNQNQDADSKGRGAEGAEGVEGASIVKVGGDVILGNPERSGGSKVASSRR